MTLTAAVTLAACAAYAMLGVLALRSRSPLAAPLAAMSADLLLWNFASFAYAISGLPGWHLLDTATSPFTPALGLHFALVYVGRRRSLRSVLALSYVFFGVVAACSVVGFFFPRTGVGAGGLVWSVLFLGGVVVAAGFVLGLLLSHHRRSAGTEDGARTRLLILALPLGAAFGATDMVHMIVPSVPELAVVGAVGCALSMAVVTVRLQLFGRDLSTTTTVHAAGIAITAVVAYYVVFHVFAASTAMLVIATATLTLAVVAATRRLASDAAAERERVAKLALAGRFSAQMAHDLRNPLAALKGAAQFLKEEADHGRPLEGHVEFIDLIADQSTRLERLIDEYQRLWRVEAVLAPLDVASLVREVSGLQAFASKGIELRVVADGPLPALGDKDLLARTLDNLMRNAVEAMPEGGTLTVRAEPAERGVTIAVEDTGVGMDARERERAFDEFFTTKAAGSGLGLAFVQRVAEAHGGRVTLSSKPGCGTVCTLRLPVP